MSIEDQLKKSQQLFQARQFSESETCLKDILAEHPDHHDAQLGYALVLLMLSRPDESWEYLKQAQSSNPENPKVYQAIAMLMRMTGAIEQGITYLQLQMTTSPMLINPQVHVTLAELYAAQGSSEAIQTLLDFLKHLPLTAHRQQYWLYREIKDAEGLEALGQRTEDHGFRNLCNGQAAAIRGDSELAHQYHQWAIEANPQLWEALLALAASPKTRVSQSQQYLMKAKQLAPQTAEVHISMAEWLNRSHQETEAQTLAKRLSESPAVFQSIRQRAETILGQ
ncbi:MAG: tetratricopeptide repeat protein [Myxococcota bacterium]|nr:tetratricopeptide repeat protein [Myxococcota bacterium]MEC8381184.1 tetratricopeptide repeat protein [Myxococcota bacterium]